MVEQTAPESNTRKGITEHYLARAVAFEIMNDLYVGVEDFHVEVRHCSTTGNVIHAEGWTEDDESFDFTCTVKFS